MGAFARNRHNEKPSGLRCACVIVCSSCFCNALAAGVEVEVAGLEDELEQNVLAYLSIAELGQQAEDSDAETEVPVLERDVRRLHAAAPSEIEQALRPFGYYEPVVRSTLQRSEDRWSARYDVDRGAPTLIEEIEIRVLGEGRSDPTVREILDTVPFAAGDLLRHARYEGLKQRLFNAAYDAGYIDAAYERAEILVRPPEREADIHLVLDTGARYYFGELVIEQDILDPTFVAGFIRIEPGEPFDTDRLIDLQLALSDSGYFTDVTVDVMREAVVDQRIPIVVRTTPRRTQEYTLGVGYGTDTGPRVSLGMELRRLNRRGHRFNGDIRLSGIASTVAAEYQIPVKNVATDTMSFSASLGTQEIGDLDTDQLSLGGSWNDAWRGLQRRLYVVAHREDWTESGQRFSENVFYPGMHLTSRQAADPLFTREGHSWSADVRGGSDSLGSSTSFLRLHATGNLVRPLGPRARFLFRSEYGAIRTDELQLLPPSQRFFAGGDRSVRGYRYQDLAPVDSSGATVGGRYLFTASVELDYLFFGNYGAALFFDAGNAANDAWPDLERSVGVGMRWRSPVGMVRIDIAHPLDDPDKNYRLHLSIGSDL